MEPGSLPDEFQSLNSEQTYYYKQFQKDHGLRSDLFKSLTLSEPQSPHP